MKGNNSEKVIINDIMELKLKDKRRYQRETNSKRDEARLKLEGMTSKNHCKKIISQINGEAQRWRKIVK